MKTGINPTMETMTLRPGQMTLADLRHIFLHPVKISLDESAHAPIQQSVDCVQAILAEKRTAYGINTGFG